MKTDKIIAEQIASEYAPKVDRKVIALKKLDNQAKKGAKIFAYSFGCAFSLVLGTGMCFSMGEIGDGSTTLMIIGIIIGILGILGVSINYPIYQKILQNGKEELIKYRRCSWIMLLLNIALSIMVFFMVYWNRTFNHHSITTIAIAAYTFISFTVAIVNYIKYKKYKSPIFNATKSISLASASVSIITLEATMLTSFGTDLKPTIRKLFLGLTGGVVSIFVLMLAVIIIVKSSKQLNQKGL